MNKVTIALVLGAVFALGCGDKTDGAGSGSAKASAAASVKSSAAPAASSAAPAASSAAAPADSAGGSDAPVGVQECDDYIKKWKECYKDPTIKAAMEPAFKQLTDGWRKTASEGQAQKDGLKVGCKASLDAFPKDGCK